MKFKIFFLPLFLDVCCNSQHRMQTRSTCVFLQLSCSTISHGYMCQVIDVGFRTSACSHREVYLLGLNMVAIRTLEFLDIHTDVRETDKIGKVTRVRKTQPTSKSVSFKLGRQCCVMCHPEIKPSFFVSFLHTRGMCTITGRSSRYPYFPVLESIHKRK